MIDNIIFVIVCIGLNYDLKTQVMFSKSQKGRYFFFKLPCSKMN